MDPDDPSHAGPLAPASIPGGSSDPLAPATIRMLAGRLPAVFTGSPQFVHEGLSARAGRLVIVKVETVNPTRSFKGRRTWVAIEALVGEGGVSADRPLVAASTGNFGQGVAYAARAFGVPAVVFADEHANPVKPDRIRALGAEVIQTGHDFDAAHTASERYASGRGACLVVDGQDPRIAAGAATLALEVGDAVSVGSLPALGAAYVPVGNGALIVGVGAWLRHVAPSCRIIGAALVIVTGSNVAG